MLRRTGVLLTRIGPVLALSVDQLVAWGVLYYAYTVLSRPIADDLAVPRIEVAAAFSACLLVAGWAGRRVGTILDRRGTRGPLRLGALLAPPIFASLALARGEVGLLVAFALLGVVHALTLYEPAFRTLVDWFPEERARSRAMSLLTSVGGLASTSFLPLSGWLVDAYGWRTAVLVLASLLAAVLVPLRFSLALPDHRRAPPSPSSDALPSRSSTLLAITFSIHTFASTGVFVSLMWHLVERGTSPATAATIAGVAGAAQVPGRLIVIPLRRAIGGSAFLPLLLAMQAVALLGVVLATGVLETASMLVFGAASGMMTLERATVLVEWYGRATFGARQGRLSAATSVARAIAPFVVEVGHRVASYRLVFGTLAVLLAGGAYLARAAARARPHPSRLGPATVSG
jgi:MFS family permease